MSGFLRVSVCASQVFLRLLGGCSCCAFGFDTMDPVLFLHKGILDGVGKMIIIV
jgi:hypothetical protein